MTEYIDFEGKSVDHALKRASLEMKVDIDALKYDVVSYGSSGIFGLVGVKKAKIRVRQNGSGAAGITTKVETRQHARDLVKDAFGIEDKETSVEETVEPKEEAVQAPDPERDAIIEKGKEALLQIIEKISDTSTVVGESKNNRIIYKIEGGDSALLIGKRGQTLEAIQYLLEKIINKQNDTRLRVLVDVEGYLTTRKTNLKRLATKMAEKAKRINKPVSIGQMNAYDRRIVHMHLKDNNAVRTQSMGDGYYRKLVIFPKRRKRNRKPQKQ